MTRSEYENLLKSDYWKGYSYSLIKERNFTCQDCGRCFPGERNKLEVHHLVYRNINPWSYRPEEVVVLCEECHKKRHGIKTDYQRKEETFNYGQNREPFSSIYTQNRQKFSHASHFTDTRTNNFAQSAPTRRQQEYAHPKKKKKNISLLPILLLLLFAYLIYQSPKPATVKENSPEPGSNIESIKIIPRESIQKIKTGHQDKTRIKEQSEETVSEVENTKEIENTDETYSGNTMHNDGRNIASKEKITSEILDEITHQNAVNSANRAGVSTEGTTSEILDRISHQNAVNSAKRTGVSTEGTTSEILDRIAHQNAMNRAREAGISVIN